MSVTNDVINHCNKYKLCKGCPFVGGKCVAPVGEHLYLDWLKMMSDLISNRNEKK